MKFISSLRSGLALTAAAALLTLVACGESNTADTDDTAAELAGNWTTTTPDELNLSLDIEASGTYTFTIVGSGDSVTGNWTLDGDAITLSDTEGSLFCEGLGVYSLVTTNTTADFTLVEDSCSGRSSLLPNATWNR